MQNQPNSRWYSDPSIYRNVLLTVANPVHVAQLRTYITTPSVNEQSTTMENNNPSDQNVEITQTLLDARRREINRTIQHILQNFLLMSKL